MIPMMRQDLLKLSKPTVSTVATNCIKYSSFSASELARNVPFNEYTKMFMGKPNENQTIQNQGINLASTYMCNIQSANRFLWLLTFATYNEQQSAIFDAIFKRQCVDPKQFARSMFDILMMVDPKINTLFIHGPPNTGKTLLLGLLTDLFISVRITIQDCKGSFYFQQCLGRTVIFADELFITKDTVDSWKMILAGHVVDINCKNSSYQRLCRTPVFIASNHRNLGRGYLNPCDESALKVRCHVYEFRNVITSLITCNLDKAAFAYWLYDQIKEEFL